ncbi:MAG: hypothetical protein D6791_16935 [Chloroflexi bacterium]|nr:MAG: hypothetical protein D6791_16935 [Chloroflexota bacterium]
MNRSPRSVSLVLTLTVFLSLLLFGAVLVRAAPTAQSSPDIVTHNTLRVYGDANEGAGDKIADDPKTDITPEEAPYTDLASITDPRGSQAPIKDFVTWDPAWLSELESFDELHAYGLYSKIFLGAVNGAEKVNLREWYEPQNIYLDHNGNGVADSADVVGLAIMQEYTYQLVQYGTSANQPPPAYAQVGNSSFVFPVGMRGGDLFVTDSQVAFDPYGYGLTSLDGDFDGRPDIVKIDSEATLSQKTGVQADFDGDNVLDNLDTDGIPLSGDEMVVLSLDPVDRTLNQAVQFLDHMVVLKGVTNGGVSVDLWYTGDLAPFYMGSQVIAQGDMWLFGRHFPGTQAPNMGVVPAGAFFIQVTNVDTADNMAQLRVGRALGAPYSAMVEAPGVIDRRAGDPWFLKRFYVDGHQYDVVAIGSNGKEQFGFITVRTPVPKADVSIELHSVRLQAYGFEEWLSLLPPFNYEHYALHDVLDVPHLDPADSARVMGTLYGPLAPILQRHGPFPYRAYRDSDPAGVLYSDPDEMVHFYVREEANLSLLNEHKQLLADVPTPEPSEFWYVQQNWTLPYLFTEFVFPDAPASRTANKPDLYLFTGHFTTTIPAPGPRIAFWYDPASDGKLLKDSNGLRVYGFDSLGAGVTVTDPVSATFPVEELPYTDPWAPFNPKHVQAPPGDSVSFNPAYMNEFRHTDEDLADLYRYISREGANARQKVYLRLWYEPDHLDKILDATAPITYHFPALMLETTTLLLNTQDQPDHGQPGSSSIAFPMATAADELPVPETSSPFNLPAADLPSNGYGITGYDANFDGIPDITRIHSEVSLAKATGVSADFDGDGQLDQLDTDGVALSGDELVVLAVENISLGVGDSAQFLDHLVTLENVTGNNGGQAQLQIWNTGGGLNPIPGGYDIKPQRVGSALPYSEGDMGIVGRDKVNVFQIPAGGNNLGDVDGAWFVYVSGINSLTEEATVTIGRALGATHSAIDNGAGIHDLLPGDPWYLKRFFVDGHEYNVVALYTPPTESQQCSGDVQSTLPECFEFKYLTLRTPVPKLAPFPNEQDTQVLEGYFFGPQGMPFDRYLVPVPPPFNMDYTAAEDIVALDPLDYAQPGHYDPQCSGADTLLARPPLEIRILSESLEPRYTGDLQEIRQLSAWDRYLFATVPDLYTELSFSPNQLYLLTSSWQSSENNEHHYACQPDPASYTPQTQLDNNRVQYTYNPGNDEDLYINTFDRVQDALSRALDLGWNLYSTAMLPADPAIDSVLQPVIGNTEVALGYDCAVGGLSYYPSLPTLSTLKWLTGWHGYWLKTTGVDTLTTYGWKMAADTPLYLCPGWNLIPYLPDQPAAIRSALAGIEGLYGAVLGYENGALSFYPNLPDTINTLLFMKPGYGYWIWMDQPATLFYPNLTSQSVAVNQAQTPSAAHPSHRWVDFYGLDSDLSVGSHIQVFTADGLLVGETIVRQEGMYGVLPVYGDDPTTDAIDGALPGEQLFFRIDGQPAVILGPGEARWTQNHDLQELNIMPARGRIYMPIFIR